MTNQRIAVTFERVAELLAQQGAAAHRVRAWRDGARTIRAHDRELADVFRDHGRVGLEALPHIGTRLASVIIELLRTGHCAALDRLRGDSARILEHVPGVGHCLAQRLQRELGIESLEELETAAHDGSLATVPGFGPRRIAGIRDVLATRLRRHPAEPPPGAPPSIDLLLEIDREYREAAAELRLPQVAPRRFNPGGTAWLPIWHLERAGWQFTALFSNTALAHKLHRTNDWVIIHFHEPHGPDGQVTVVTERRGALSGSRVVRGREPECEQFYERREPLRRTG